MKLSNIQILADMLISAREAKGYSQRQLAHIIEVSNSEISKLEKGLRQKPNLDILKKISDVLDIKYEEMLEVLGYIKSDYSFEDNTHSLSESEKDNILNIIIDTLSEKNINTFSNKEELKQTLFGNDKSHQISNKECNLNNEIPQIYTILKDNIELIKNNEQKLYDLIKWFVNSM